jgi:hypothetical protein
MKRKRAGRELFEVFRSEAGSKAAHSWWLKRSDGTPDKAKAKRPRSKAARRDATTPPGRVTLTFTREALIIGVVILAGSVLGAFALGYARGKSNGPREIAQLDSQAGQGAGLTEFVPYSSLSLNIADGQEFFTLRLIEKLTLEQALRMVADLRAMGYDAFALKDGDTYNINAGRFADWRTSQADEYKQKMKSLVYGEQRWFTSARWYKVGSPRE